MRLRSWVAAAVAVGLVAAACTSGQLGFVDPSPSPTGPVAHPTAPDAQQDPFCEPVPSVTQPGPTSGALPPDIARVANQVQDIRGLRFKDPVIPQPLSQQQIQQELQDSLTQQIPVDAIAREQRTDITIGALPPGTDLRQVLIGYGTSQIIGFYDTTDKRLVFEGGAQPTPFEQFTLAHELTHALQDQNFDLARLDRLNAACQDERAQAFLSLAEGDAVATQIQWAQANLTADQIVELQDEANSFPPPPATPPFVEETFLFPYPNGQAFVDALVAKGGEKAVDEAFRDPPVSTEQILHPERYPSDVPQAVAVPDLSAELGSGWSLFDQQEVGEGMLRILLGLRLSKGVASDAAAGWDGGLMRSWSSGSSTAVLMQTVWDSEKEAGEFTSAMRDWFEQQAAEVLQDGTQVRVLFGSDAQALAVLRTAAAA